MAHIYIDESGDLGMERGTKYFILSGVLIEDDSSNKSFQRIPKQVRQRKLKKILKEATELKFSNSPVNIRNHVLQSVDKCNIKIFILVIEKKYTVERLRKNLPILYNYLIKILLESIIQHIQGKEKVSIIIDKCMSSKQLDNFKTYVGTEFLTQFQQFPDINITQENSRNNNGIQVTDFIVGAFGYKYNHCSLGPGHQEYTKQISSKIQLERNDFFKKNGTNPA